MARYELPAFLNGKITQDNYSHWLRWKANAHVKRDKKRGNLVATGEAYRIAIHDAVCNGGHVDAYTGNSLDWELLRTYNNEKAKQGKRQYKKTFANLPTVDHEDDGMGDPKFKICAWRTNDCKSDLSVDELAKFCRDFLDHQERKKALLATSN